MRDPDFWTGCLRQAQDGAIRADPVEDWTFDILIVDEAQDFEGDWFDVAGLFLRDKADVLWLEDPSQNLPGLGVGVSTNNAAVGVRSDPARRHASTCPPCAAPECPLAPVPMGD